MLSVPRRRCVSRTGLLRLWSRLLAATFLTIASAAPVAATHDPRHGEVCSGPGEPSFICGEVRVQMHVGVDIQPVLAACQPLGEVLEVSGLDYLIAVRVGSEIALRDCYALQPGVGHADLPGFGSVTPDGAMPPVRSNPWFGIGTVVALTGLLLAVFYSALRQRRD